MLMRQQESKRTKVDCNPTSLNEEVLLGHLGVQRRLGLRVEHQILQVNS
jgi:hypothetical protein